MNDVSKMIVDYFMTEENGFYLQIGKLDKYPWIIYFLDCFELNLR